MSGLDDLFGEASELEYRRQIRELTGARDEARRDARATAADLENAQRVAEFLSAVRAAQTDIRLESFLAPGQNLLGTERREACALVVLSDWHVEERVDPEVVQGLNRYTPKIAEFRFRRAAEAIVWLIREKQSRFDVRRILLGVLGDMITGYIHEELQESNYLSPPKATAFAARLVGDLIQHLLDADIGLETIAVVFKCGNHGRTTHRVRTGTGVANSYEWIAYHIVMQRFADNPRVVFQLDEGHHSISEVYGMRIHTHHGDSVRSMGGVGGVDIPLNRSAARWREKYRAHVSIVGHFHEQQFGAKVLRNGSGIGYSSYADWLAHASPEPAQQIFCLIDKKRGLCHYTPLWVSDRSEEDKL